MPKKLILEIDGEGGSIKLLKINDQYAYTTNYSALYDLLNEDDREGMSFQSSSKLFDSFDAAMQSMAKKYSVFRLVLIEIDTSYKNRIKEYLLKYLSNTPGGSYFKGSRMNLILEK